MIYNLNCLELLLKMLKLFLEHPRQILSKNQILERLFDVDGEFVDENTVPVNISSIPSSCLPQARPYKATMMALQPMAVRLLSSEYSPSVSK